MARQKMEKSNPLPETSGHTVPVGDTGAGKTTIMSKMVFALSDTNQLVRKRETDLLRKLKLTPYSG